MNSELLLKVFHIFYIGGKAGDGVTLPCLRVWFSFFVFVFFFNFITCYLKRPRASDPFILLQSFRNFKKKKKDRQNLNHS